MRKRTKALAITKATKEQVFERDGYCILCGKAGSPDAHYISRAQGGLGVEQNVVTLCTDCHRRYDQTAERPLTRAHIRVYLQSKYPDWDENKLIYRKYGG